MSRKTLIILIFLTAFIISFTYNILLCRDAEVLTHWSQHIDGLFYQAIAETIVEHGVIGYNEARPTSFRPPLYPILLSGVYLLFGYNFLAVRVLQSILHALTSILIFLIGEKIFGRNAGTGSGFLFALNPFLIFFSGEIGTETLFTFFTAATIFSVTVFIKSGNKKILFSGAVLFVAAMLTRTVLLGFLPFLILLIYFISSKEEGKKNAVIFALIFCVAILPWVVRNYAVHGHFIISGTNMGHNLNIGALMEGVDYAEGLKKFKKIAGYDYKDLENPKNRSLPASEYVLQKEGIERALALIYADPLKWIKVRALNAFNLWSNNWKGSYAKKFNREKKSYIKTVSHYYYLFILLFGVFGIAVSATGSDIKIRQFLYMTLLLFISLTAAYCIFQTGKRYRVPVIDPYLAIYASYFICTVKEKILPVKKTFKESE